MKLIKNCTIWMRIFIAILVMASMGKMVSPVSVFANEDGDVIVDDISLNPTSEEQLQLLSKAKDARDIINNYIYTNILSSGEYIPTLDDDAAYLMFTFIQCGFEAKDNYYQDYYNGICEELESKQDNDLSILGWCKLIMLAAVLGEDPTDIGGHNAIAIICNKDNVDNSSDYMKLPTILLAIDMDDYELPVGDEYLTREEIINQLSETANAETNSSDIDMMCMNIQPLYKYYNKETVEGNEYYSVKTGVENVLNILGNIQLSNGYYNGWGTNNNPWTETQVLITWGLLEINPLNEEHGYDIIKNGITVVDAMLEIIDFDSNSLIQDYSTYDPAQFSRGFEAVIRGIEGSDSFYSVSLKNENSNNQNQNQNENQDDEENNIIESNESLDINKSEAQESGQINENNDNRDEKKDSTPETGDNIGMILIYSLSMVLSIGFMVTATIKYKRQ